MARSYPYGYGRATCSLDRLVDRFGAPMHPEYRSRLFAWIEAQHGRIGIGSGWRPTPDPVSPASMAGHSFHQDQRFASGLTAIAAVDLVARGQSGHVHRAPRWSEVPAQGSEQSRVWGLHANVRGEPWHLQPIELDGFQSWRDHGRTDPAAGYPYPGRTPRPDPIDPPTDGDDEPMTLLYATDPRGRVWVGDTITRRMLHGWTSVMRAQQAGVRCRDFVHGTEVKAGTKPGVLSDEDLAELGKIQQ